MNFGPYFNHSPSYHQRYANYQYPLSGQQFTNYNQQAEPYYSQTPFEHFAKPKQPTDWYQNMQPNQSSNAQPQPNAPNGLLSQFQDENGQINIDKMLSTVGQMANTYHQVQPIIKQFGDLMKTFR
ncbi:YppG-like protein [Oceanobacillus limi]|uniref:YppG-like protein n=1 Tax=Oceanobacillus limi TaxID=930131 RepID=A0A1I0H857_9BACI|nr:YppG family protein [Oceanobacillus limi]SET79792.1 YppG-like protein [Oceanobacillus limi]